MILISIIKPNMELPCCNIVYREIRDDDGNISCCKIGNSLTIKPVRCVKLSHSRWVSVPIKREIIILNIPPIDIFFFFSTTVLNLKGSSDNKGCSRKYRNANRSNNPTGRENVNIDKRV